MIHTCEFYHFLRAVRGNWRNAVYVRCGCDACLYGRAKPCPGFLLTIDETGKVLLLPAELLRELTGEEADPSECCAVLPRRAFEAAFSKYMEWHTADPAGCPLRQLCLNPNCGQSG